LTIAIALRQRARRITVIGNGGCGKTTLSCLIGESLNLPVHHMDRIQFLPGLVSATDEAIRQELEQIMAEPEWLIDGLGRLWTIEMRLPLADAIVFVDFPLEQCKEWAMRRQVETRGVVRPDMPEGTTTDGLDQRLMEVLEWVDRDMTPTIREWMAAPENAERVIWIRSREELAELSAALAYARS
jgi:adenylate kinase family enzyme